MGDTDRGEVENADEIGVPDEIAVQDQDAPPRESDIPPIHNFSVRDLAEVLLLLDNVSASDRANLPDSGTIATPPFDDPKNWIQEICAIRWPPSPLDAKQAAKLLLARDALNTAARPATGRSIAFTLMVLDQIRVQKGVTAIIHDFWLNFWRGLWRGGPAESANAIEVSEPTLSGSVPSRSLLATIAFPDLIAPARRFRNSLTPIWLLVASIFVATCYVSFDVASGNRLLAAYNDDVATVQRAIKAIVPPTADAGAYLVDQGGARIAFNEAGCAADTRPVPEMWAKCLQLATAVRSLRASSANIVDWDEGRLTYGGARAVIGRLHSPAREGVSPAELEASNIKRIVVSLGVLGGSFLPILYGVMGAAVAVARSLLAKMEKSTLTPRFRHITYLRLLLGAVIGGCVGIFAVAPSEDPASAEGLLSTVHLSSAALCFLAGYGVDVVFAALDGLLLRAMHQPAANGDKPPTL